MTPKRQPVVETRNRITIQVRLQADQRQRLETAAKRVGLGIGPYMRAAALEKAGLIAGAHAGADMVKLVQDNPELWQS